MVQSNQKNITAQLQGEIYVHAYMYETLILSHRRCLKKYSYADPFHQFHNFLLLFSACVSAVKSRPVLHHCVVIFFWSSGIMECTCMLFTFENNAPLMR